MSNLVKLPTSWACSPSQANDQEQEQRLEELAEQTARDVAEIIGVEYRPYHACQIGFYLRYGFTQGMIYAAAESTTMAPCPSWAYFKAIMRNCSRDGCHTVEEYEQRIQGWKSLAPYETRKRWSREISLGQEISLKEPRPVAL